MIQFFSRLFIRNLLFFCFVKEKSWKEFSIRLEKFLLDAFFAVEIYEKKGIFSVEQV